MRTDEKEQNLCVKEWATLVEKIKEGKYKLPIDAIIVNGKNISVTIKAVSNEKSRIEIICKERISSVFVGKMLCLRIPDIKVRFKYGRDALNKYITLLDE